MELNRDFSEFIASCAEHDVRFMIVGGYAVAVHGHPRFTKDLDVWVWVDEENANRLVSALDDFGFGSVGLTADDFLEEGMVVQLGYPPKRIDIITQVDGVEFAQCWDRHIDVEVGGQRVPFISLEYLLSTRQVGSKTWPMQPPSSNYPPMPTMPRHPDTPLTLKSAASASPVRTGRIHFGTKRIRLDVAPGVQARGNRGGGGSEADEDRERPYS